MVRRAFLCLIAVLVPLASAGAARADADPASDTLYQHKLFRSYFPKISPAVEAQLVAAIRDSVAAGREVRVALIASPNDLGGIPSLFGRPTEYARFLDAELQFVYSGRVLVVMPQGAGLAKSGRLVADRAVIAARPGRGADGLARTATMLVRAISGTGVAQTGSSQRPRAAEPRPTPAQTSRFAAPANVTRPATKGTSVWIATGIAVPVVAIILVIGLAIVSRRRRSFQP